MEYSCIKLQLIIHIARFGPYHLTRIDSAFLALLIDNTEQFAAGNWELAGSRLGVPTKLLTASGSASRFSLKKQPNHFPQKGVQRYPGALNELRPDAIAIAGWGSPDSRACLDWCQRNGAKAVVLSETRETDGDRGW